MKTKIEEKNRNILLVLFHSRKLLTPRRKLDVAENQYIDVAESDNNWPKYSKL